MRHVKGVGPETARLLVLGEAPGRTEIEKGEPFVGASGWFLDEALGGPGVRQLTRLLNVRTYLPPEKEPEKQRSEGIRACRAGLNEQLAKLQNARTILCVGADAAEAILGVCGPQRLEGKQIFPSITEYHASVFTRREVEALRAEAGRWGIECAGPLPHRLHTVLVTYHPAFAMRGQPQFKPWIRTTISRASRWAQREEGPTRPHAQSMELVATPAQIEGAIRIADSQGLPVEIDVETDRETGTKIHLFGIAIAKSAWVCRWEPELVRILNDAANRAGVFVGHNLSFDMKALAANGMRFGRRLWACTMAAGSLLWPPFEGSKQRKWLSIAGCTTRVCDGIAYWKRHENPATRAIYSASWPSVPPSLYEELYNALDCWYGLRLWEQERALLTKEGML